MDESKLPRAWYNINADMPVPPEPVLHPQTLEPVTPDFLSVLFPMSLIMQEISTERYIEIPEPVREMYKLWRPTPMFRARRLELALDTPAHIYYKYEGVSPVGSHKPNTAVPQAFYNKQKGHQSADHRNGRGPVGFGAGDGLQLLRPGPGSLHGEGLLQQKPYRRMVIESYGAQVFPSPTDRTQYGRSVLAQDPRFSPARWASPSPKRWKWRPPPAA
jgi:tryptophan synthase beta chain